VASGSAKAALFDAQASVALALGSGRRAEIVDVLAQGERSVEELANEISQSVANTSQHLQVLARAGLVRPRRQGTRIFYRLASQRVSELWAAVRDVAVRHVAEVSVLAEDYLGEREEVEQLSAE
jgi:DNA-binding transcriptional ArsR family regulator